MSSSSILIVEDEKDLRDAYVMILKHAGYKVYASANGAEALKQLDAAQPRLVLLDIFMPVMDGRKFLENTDLSRYPDTKVLVCSNTSDDALIKDMIKLGANEVITKADLTPLDLAAVVAPYMRA